MKLLITGGAGFIGSAVIRHIVAATTDSVVNVDKLTYAGNLDSLHEVSHSDRYAFEHVDICDRAELERIFRDHKPDAVMHLAAESHVDRSIGGPAAFIATNIVGTFNLLEVAREYWNKLAEAPKAAFRFHHISTDEVYGDLCDGDPVTEATPYAPSSPYSASKASADHLVRAWRRTYGLPTLISNCSNNYGPYQFPEKLIPLMIHNALDGRPLPVYGRGEQIRDWLYVEDHARALYAIVTRVRIGESYNVGAHNEQRNIDVVERLCDKLEELAPAKPPGVTAYRDLISFVEDRPGHDLRYAIDATKIKSELGWGPTETLESGLDKTVKWYLDNRSWLANVSLGPGKDGPVRIFGAQG